MGCSSVIFGSDTSFGYCESDIFLAFWVVSEDFVRYDTIFVSHVWSVKKPMKTVTNGFYVSSNVLHTLAIHLNPLNGVFTLFHVQFCLFQRAASHASSKYENILFDIDT